MLTSLLAMLLAGPAHALGFADSPQGLGLGVVGGSITGIGVAYRPGPKATLGGAVGWNLRDTALNVQGDYRHEMFDIPIEEAAGVMLQVGLGGGAFADLYDSYSQLGVYVPVGFVLLPGDRPFDLFLDIAPGMALLPATKFVGRGTAGVRLYFQ